MTEPNPIQYLKHFRTHLGVRIYELAVDPAQAKAFVAQVKKEAETMFTQPGNRFRKSSGSKAGDSP